jgi:hypothetical protein
MNNYSFQIRVTGILLRNDKILLVGFPGVGNYMGGKENIGLG